MRPAAAAVLHLELGRHATHVPLTGVIRLRLISTRYIHVAQRDNVTFIPATTRLQRTLHSEGMYIDVLKRSYTSHKYVELDRTSHVTVETLRVQATVHLPWYTEENVRTHSTVRLSMTFFFFNAKITG